jgi:hypothetical protein
MKQSLGVWVTVGSRAHVSNIEYEAQVLMMDCGLGM